MSVPFTVDDRAVVDVTFGLERQPLSHGIPGQSEPELEPASGLAACEPGSYLRGLLVINTKGCKNALGAQGQGRVEIWPTQHLGTDTDGQYHRDGDRGICEGFLCGPSEQKPGTCRCVFVLRAAAVPPTTAPITDKKESSKDNKGVVAVAVSLQDNLLLGFTAEELAAFDEDARRLSCLIEHVHWADEENKPEKKYGGPRYPDQKSPVLPYSSPAVFVFPAWTSAGVLYPSDWCGRSAL